MKSNTPITSRVQAKFKSLTMPVNQEVTLNANGTGGPIIAPSGHIVNAPKKSCGCESPAKKALVGNQKNLPPQIKEKILAAPDKMKSKEDKSSNKEPKFMENIEMNSESPAKQAKPSYTDRLYKKSQKLTNKAAKVASEGKYKKAARLENRAARVDDREAKKRAKVDYKY